MTNKLFNKAVVFTDIHYGLKNNSQEHNNDCDNFIKWAVKKGLDEGSDTCIFLGDWHHCRSSLNLHTLNYSLKALELLNDSFKHVYFITGNHDLYYRDKRDIYSFEWAKHLPNITIINDKFVKDDVAFVPWLVGDDYKNIKKIKAKYMFGHFELPHFMMNALVEMPDSGTINSEQMANIEHVYSGHFHMRQSRGNVTYIGNCFPHNFSDNGDDQRGIAIIDWDKGHTFHAWPDQPLYLVTKLSALLDDADSLLKPQMVVKVDIDVNISYEEANFVKETFLTKYNLREISLIPSKNKTLDEDTLTSISINNIDTIINEQIQSIESDHYDTNMLMKIYNDL